jgi:hypothetical protein
LSCLIKHPPINFPARKSLHREEKVEFRNSLKNDFSQCSH